MMEFFYVSFLIVFVNEESIKSYKVVKFRQIYLYFAA